MIPVTTLSELTIDGKLTLGRGASSKDLFDFYGDDLRQWFHAERARHDAIMVGAGTVRSDDPELTVRHATGPNPLRVVPSSDGRLPPDSRILNDGIPTLIAVPEEVSDETVARLCRRDCVDVIRCGRGRVDLGVLMVMLEQRGISSVVAEGGTRLLHSLFADNLVTRIIIKHIPVLTGSPDAATFLGDGAGAAPVQLSRWVLEDLFVKSGVPVSIYVPLAARS